MKLPRPGPDIAPQKEHVVLAMLITMNMAGGGWEYAIIKQACAAATKEMWGWDNLRFAEELNKCRQVMIENGGRLTCWFTPEGMEFDFNVPQ